MDGRHYACGAVYGIVTNNADPDGLGRVKVQIYHLGADIQTGWINVTQPDLGMFVLPDVGDQVVVAFLGDNPDMPFVLGTQHSIKQPPPKTGENTASDLNKDGKNYLKLFKSDSGNMLIFDDTKDNEKIQIISSKGVSRIEIRAKDTGMLFSTGKGMKFSAKGNINIEAEECNIKVKKGLLMKSENIKAEGRKNVNVKAGNSMAVKANGINLN